MLPVTPLNTHWKVLYFLYQYVWENPSDYKGLINKTSEVMFKKLHEYISIQKYDRFYHGTLYSSIQPLALTFSQLLPFFTFTGLSPRVGFNM